MDWVNEDINLVSCDSMVMLVSLSNAISGMSLSTAQR